MAGQGARDMAVRTLAGVLDRGLPIDDAVDAFFAAAPDTRLDPRDRAFGYLLAVTTLRRLGEIDAMLMRHLDKGWPKAATRLPHILRVAVAQFAFLDGPAHAAIDMAVSQVKRDRRAHRYDKLANAVLRNITREEKTVPVPTEAGVLNTPAWLFERWSATYGAETAQRIAAAHLDPPHLDLTLKDANTQGQWAERLSAAPLASGSLRLPGRPTVDALPGYAEGAWWVQDAAATLPAQLLGDVRGFRVADLCAAPGGKAAQLAAAGATVLSVEQSQKRITRLHENLDRLKLADRVTVIEADAINWRPETPVDAVLLDAPCSATGTIRRHPDVARVKTPEVIAELAALQAKMLDAAVDMVRPGGVVVFCTCSLEPEEGVHQIAGLLSRRSDVARAPITPTEFGWPADWITADGDLRTLPFHNATTGAVTETIGLDGFYACRLRRMEP